ncbi:Outer membrane protein assembly factor BamB, contains PQQ-like beta-propeller repeat [Nonomuraea maritima]|uniref:alpha-amylase n=1 Tax=Nonomuraea maritima TaxID=683260 RepID=A0A1G8W5J6_9ACTN|nr:PQQ-binding-like beta-propeller repeat protein [Nonomuraea maritima]SDJ73591.1 Outer membrane protein assembly factor BamB, contains PQQ-like beta-propeller repeat [Nonomuraea maritima]
MSSLTWTRARLRVVLYTTTLGLAAGVVGGPLASYAAAAIDPPEATVSGVVYVDANGDGQRNPGEAGLAGVRVSDGKVATTTAADGSYSLTISTDRRRTDIVWASQPRGYRFGLDQYKEPKFWANLGELADDATATADFGLVRDELSDGNAFSWANIADPHVNAQLPDQIREINSTGTDLRFIAVSGDLTNDASQGQFDTYRRGAQQSAVGVWPAVGNHEYGSGSAYAERIENYRRNVGPEWYSFNYGNRHFVVLENNGSAPFEEELAWLQDDLAASVPLGKDQKDKIELVVLTHQPMNVPFGSPSEYDAFGDVLEKYDAQLILVGHEHSNHVEKNSKFASTAKHIQTVSSSYTIDNAPRGFRYIHMAGPGFDNPFRMYGENEHLTIVSPAPGSTVPAVKFPGIQVNAYDTGDEVVSASYRLDGDQKWSPLRHTGEFTWQADLPANRQKAGDHRVDVQVVDAAGKTWTKSADFTLTHGPGLKPVAGDDWDQHHGDAAHSGIAPAQEAGRRLAWSFRTEGTFLTGSPVIHDGVVYAGTRDENGDGNSRLHAVRLKDGKELWNYEVPQSIHGSLAYGDGLVLAPTLGSELYAVDAKKGELRWKAVPEEAPAPNNQRTYGYYSPAVSGHTVLWPYQTRFGIGSQGVLKALDTRTGKQIWASPMSGNQMSDGTPAVMDGTVYVGNQTADRVLAYDLATGARKWTGTESLGSWQDGVPTAADGKVFIGANNGIAARDAKTGETLWTYTSPRSSLVSSGSTPSAAAVKDGVVYMGFPSGAVVALDARTGNVFWERALPGDIYHGGVMSSPVVAGDTLFVGANNGRFYALATDTGQILWSHEIGTWVGAGPAVSGNTVVTGTWDGNLYAYVPGGESAQRWATVTGTVSDPETGAAIAGAKVTAVADGQDTAVTTTDAKGHYRIGLPAATWTVTAAKRGLIADERSTVAVTVRATGSAKADLKLIKVNHPVAGKSTYAPDYGNGSTRTDVVNGKEYFYLANDKVRASVTPYAAGDNGVGGNNGAGGLGQGALSDLMLGDANGAETLDWGEMLLRPSLTPPDSWERPNDQLDLPGLAVDGAAVVGDGQYRADPSIKARVRYETLPDAPIVKMTVKLTNTGTTAYQGYFNYMIDPDSSVDNARIPGFAGVNPGLKTSGWTGNYVYVGADTATTNGQAAHALAWAQDTPAAVGGFGYVDGLYYDASMAPGATKEFSFYHLTDYATSGGDPTGNIARWVDEIDLHDTTVPDAARAAGTITAGGSPVPGARVVLEQAGTAVASTGSDAQGTYLVKAPAGEYDVRVSKVGYQTATGKVTVPAAGSGGADVELSPVTVEASYGKQIGSGLVEAGPGDVMLENDKLSMAIADAYNDSQLSGGTRGKPVDLAVRGMADQFDWINLPYVSAAQPTGTSAWDIRSVAATDVKIVQATGDQAVVQVSGPVKGFTGLTATTTYTLKPGDDFATVSTELSNSGSAPLNVWTGDAMDHDAAGQASVIPGAGIVPAGATAEYKPTKPYFGMTGTDPQVFGLVYGTPSDAFDVYAAGNWVMSRFNVDVPAGGSYTLTRKLVVTPGSDAVSVLDGVTAP